MPALTGQEAGGTPRAMERSFHMLIDGRLVEGRTSFEVIDPATGEPFALCPKADAALLDETVAAARAALPAWAAIPIEARAASVLALAETLEHRTDEFARLLTREQGKPLDQARYEISESIRTLRAMAALRLEPRILRREGNASVVEHRTPLGIVAAITPWNLPLLLLVNKLAPALVAGNTLVAKPAPTTPLTTLLFGELCRDLLPAGVVNILCDEDDLGERLASHPDIAKISFTGSTATGRKVIRAAADTMKRLTLELGGNDAAIVLDDIDPIAVAGRIFRGAMVNAGQSCVAVKRVYVPDALYDAFCGELARLAREAVVDEGLRPGVEIGPVQNRRHYEKVKALLAEAREQGVVLAGGHAIDRPGYFIAPTIISGLPEDSRLVREEQFGPILPVLRYTDIEEAIARANDSDYALAGSVWGRDLARATQIAMRIDAGTVWVNQHLAIEPAIPFRGARQSGLGGELGEEALHAYTQAHIVNTVAFGDA